MYKIIKKFIQLGVVTVDYPKKPVCNPNIVGRPKIDDVKCNDCGECIKRCPTAAIKKSVLNNSNGDRTSIHVNIDECIFCSLCSDVCAQKAIIMTNEFELAAKKRKDLRSDTEDAFLPADEDYEVIGKRLKDSIYKHFGRSLHIREVDAGSCNGCDNEINALNRPLNDIERFGISFVASPRHADMLLVTGPVSRNMETALIKTYNAVPDPKLVVAVGACACSGGIFKDLYATKNGIDSIIPVDAYIPGCPPRPHALIYGILKAIERI